MPWMSINKWKKRSGIGKVSKKLKEPKPKKLKPVFKLIGYDTFSDEWYDLEEFLTEKQAREAGVKRLEELAISQPASSSGGQSTFGIQDRVFVETPNGGSIPHHRLKEEAMFSDTTSRVVTTAFLLDPGELLDLLSAVAKAEAESRRNLDLTYEAHRWNDLSVKLDNLSQSL